MSFLFADTTKQIAVVSPTPPPVTRSEGPSSLAITGPMDFLHHSSVTDISVVNLKKAVNGANSVYSRGRGTIVYENGLMMEGLPFISLQPTVGIFASNVRQGGVGIGLGFVNQTLSTPFVYKQPQAVLEIQATNADVLVTGGGVDDLNGGSSSLILQGKRAGNGIFSGFRFESKRDPELPSGQPGASLFIKPFHSEEMISSVRPSLLTIVYDPDTDVALLGASASVGIGTDTPQAKMEIHSVMDDMDALLLESSNRCLVIRQKGATSDPITLIDEDDNTIFIIDKTGRVGIGTNPAAADTANDISGEDLTNFQLTVKGSIRSDNSIFAFGTIKFLNNILQITDTFNVASVEIFPSQGELPVKINFALAIDEQNADTLYTAVVTETTGKAASVHVTKERQSMTVIFISVTDGSLGFFEEFSFMIFSNANSRFNEGTNEIITV